MDRRSFIKLVGSAALLPVIPDAIGKGSKPLRGKIDRKALMDRHRIVLSGPDALSPLTVGNGEFAFTADITGLQTFPEFHSSGILIETMAQWGWHTTPVDPPYKLSDTFNLYEAHGREVPYPSGDEAGGGFGDGSPAASWLNGNPHKFGLGRLGLILPSVDGRPLKIEELKGVRQELNLWTGLLTSRFEIDGHSVVVETVAHPTIDAVGIRIQSQLVAQGKIGLKLQFGFASGDWKDPLDLGAQDRHKTEVEKADGECRFSRQIDATTYTARTETASKAAFRQTGAHLFEWFGPGQSELQFVLGFAPKIDRAKLPKFDQMKRASEKHWKTFWSTGGAIDLSESQDPRWKELERRIVLSQYQTAVNSAGSLPPQETGLVQNSWFGKFHLEMHWWHAAHFALWGREAMVLPSLDYYRRILPVAREPANRIGCKGARWPKMVGPEGRESPNRINPFLTWQQPHPIHFAELIYQARPTEETLHFFRDIVLESGEFMASYPGWNEERKCFELGPPSVAAYENNFNERKTSKNPTFDLAYWSWAIGLAQTWRERLGMERSPEWDRVRNHFAPLTVKEGIYREIEEVDAGFSGHPTMLGAMGIVPEGPMVDHPTMERTLEFVLSKWPRDDMWGWDFPMAAMTAARLNRPDLAIEALLLDTGKNRYLPNGHNYQISILPLYLPGNGGLLFAVAMMAAGWKGGPKGNAPGFPSKDWVVSSEGLRPAL